MRSRNISKSHSSDSLPKLQHEIFEKNVEDLPPLKACIFPRKFQNKEEALIEELDHKGYKKKRHELASEIGFGLLKNSSGLNICMYWHASHPDSDGWKELVGVFDKQKWKKPKSILEEMLDSNLAIY